jgi:F-type H+-transporting ATPase subunit a
MAEKTILHPVEKALADAMGVDPHGEGWNAVFGDPLLTGSGSVGVTHVLMAAVAGLVVCALALMVRGSFAGDRQEAILPDPGISVRNLVEAVFDFALDTMGEIMGEEHARRYFPLIIGLSMFILVSNLLGLVPGFIPPTQNLNTTIAMGASIFICYNAIGVFRHGFAYFKEFVGPVWWLFFLMIPIEAIGHIFRPISLSVRLTGNMGGDHTVLVAFSQLAETFLGAPILLPIPFLFLGLIISVVQTLVFALLSTVYIGLAVEEGH